jgi:chromosome segregation ATPase
MEHRDRLCHVQAEMTSWNQQAAEIERKARTLQLDMEDTERERALTNRRIAKQPMDVKQASHVRDNMCALSAHRTLPVSVGTLNSAGM